MIDIFFLILGIISICILFKLVRTNKRQQMMMDKLNSLLLLIPDSETEILETLSYYKHCNVVSFKDESNFIFNIKDDLIEYFCSDNHNLKQSHAEKIISFWCVGNYIGDMAPMI